MKLPNYDVILWHKTPSTPPNLHSEILEKSSRKPYESTEYQGFRDIHWGFSKSSEAISFAESLLEFAALDDVTKLTIVGSNNPTFNRKVYKDSMVKSQNR